MRRRDDFYFVYSIASTLFILLIVYYFYEKRFALSEFMDVKTILMSSGTLFGAYFGAKIAGKYALESAEKQIEYNNKKTRLSNHDMYLKLSFRHLHSLSFTIDILTMIENSFNEHPEKKQYNGLIELIDGLVKRIYIFEEEMKTIDTSNLPYVFYNHLSKTETMIEMTRKDLIRLSDFLVKNFGNISLGQIGIETLKSNLKVLESIYADMNNLKEESKLIINENNF